MLLHAALASFLIAYARVANAMPNPSMQWIAFGSR